MCFAWERLICRGVDLHMCLYHVSSEISPQNTSLRMCSAKSDWIQSVKNATVSDFKAQKKDIEDSLHYILSKLSAQRKYYFQYYSTVLIFHA